ncbi:Acetylcholine receptor subunit alpha-type acr-16, partial [Pseudolycoriella hygida]
LFVSSRNEFIEARKHESQLLDTIFKGYDKRVRPVEDYHSSVVVNFSISFQQILKVDEKNQVITSNISVVRGQVWAPDVHLYNSASFDKQVGSQIRNVITKDGIIMDVVPMLMKSTCKIDVTWFPFDEQKCLLAFGSWSLPAKFLQIQTNDRAQDINYDFVQNEEWKILGITAENTYNYYPCCPDDEYIKIVYTIHLKRRTFYYFFNLLVPCGLIGFLAVLGFTLPPDSGEKLPLGATILFSLIVFLNMIGQSMPANSDAVPLLGII